MTHIIERIQGMEEQRALRRIALEKRRLQLEEDNKRKLEKLQVSNTNSRYSSVPRLSLSLRRKNRNFKPVEAAKIGKTQHCQCNDGANLE